MADEDKLDKILNKIAIAKGAFIATGWIGGALVVVVMVIATYMFNKIEKHDAEIATNKQEIAILKAKDSTRSDWEKHVNEKFERVKFKK